MLCFQRLTYIPVLFFLLLLSGELYLGTLTFNESNTILCQNLKITVGRLPFDEINIIV